MIDILSYIALTLSLTGNILVNYKKKIGFIVWGLSNIFWILINVLDKPNYQQITMFVIYMGLNIHGFIKWGKKNEI